MIVRNVLVFGGLALLLALAVGSPGTGRFWWVLGVAVVILIPYLAALGWLLSNSHKGMPKRRCR